MPGCLSLEPPVIFWIDSFYTFVVDGHVGKIRRGDKHVVRIYGLRVASDPDF